LVVLVVGVVVVWRATRPAPWVLGLEQVAAIDEGMTRAEVRAVLGRAPGAYGATPAYGSALMVASGALEPNLVVVVLGPDGQARAVDSATGAKIPVDGWQTRDGMLVVAYDDAGRVVGKRYHALFATTVWSRLLQAIGAAFGW
jgi:hypothetical protein